MRKSKLVVVRVTPDASKRIGRDPDLKIDGEESGLALEGSVFWEASAQRFLGSNHRLFAAKACSQEPYGHLP